VLSINDACGQCDLIILQRRMCDRGQITRRFICSERLFLAQCAYRRRRTHFSWGCRSSLPGLPQDKHVSCYQKAACNTWVNSSIKCTSGNSGSQNDALGQSCASRIIVDRGLTKEVKLPLRIPVRNSKYVRSHALLSTPQFRACGP
jgi:hypothetical protein